MSERQPAAEPLRDKLAEVYRVGGVKLGTAVLVSGAIGLTIAVIDHFRPGFGDRAMRAIERRNPRVPIKRRA